MTIRPARTATPRPSTPPAPAGGVELVKRPPGTVTERPPADVATTTTPPGRARQWVIGRPVWRVTSLVNLAEHPAATRTTHAGRVALRHGWIVGRGFVSWVERAARGATHGYEREQVRLARAAGNTEAQHEWMETLNDHRNDRIDRLTAMPKVVIGILFALGLAVGLVLLVLLVAAVVALAIDGGAGWVGWWSGVGATAVAIRDVVVVGWRLATWAAIPVGVVLAWREGKRRFDPPMWLLAPDERKLVNAEITPSKVVVALRNLGIAALRAALKDADDAGAGMLGPIAVAGPGVEVDVLLPSGVSTDQVQDRRRRLAENLDRREHELFITLPPAARTVRLWIANPGALDEPVPPSPLVLDQGLKANVKTGRAPLGQNMRADRVAMSLWQKHVLVTGLSNHGKTAILRALALWALFDLPVKFRIGDLKGFGDWSMFAGVAEVLIEGPTDSHVVAVTEMLEEAVEEMNRRLESGRDDWPTLLVVVDEAQVAFMCPAVGADKRPYGGSKNTSRYFMAARKLQNQGRAVNVLLWQGTQDPTDQNLPKLVREGAHVRMSLVVGTEQQARMALGDKAIDGGAAPHLLRQGLDKGVVVAAGDGVELPPGEPSITIRTHFIDTDAAHAVAARGIERRRKAGRLHATAGMSNAVEVDHLANIHAAMQDEKRVRTVVVLGRLIEIDADVYEPWGAHDLTAAVRVYAHLGLDVRRYEGQAVLRLEEVQKAMRERE